MGIRMAVGINTNMRCIEISLTIDNSSVDKLINTNMRCIEINLNKAEEAELY